MDIEIQNEIGIRIDNSRTGSSTGCWRLRGFCFASARSWFVSESGRTPRSSARAASLRFMRICSRIDKQQASSDLAHEATFGFRSCWYFGCLDPPITSKRAQNKENVTYDHDRHSRYDLHSLFFFYFSDLDLNEEL